MKSIFSKGNDCTFEKDCTRNPFPKECRKFCIERLLRNATLEEKQLILGFDTELANRILSLYNNRSFSIDGFKDLESRLSSEQVKLILDRFDSINQYQLNYFLRSREEREKIIQEIKRLGLDRR